MTSQSFSKDGTGVLGSRGFSCREVNFLCSISVDSNLFGFVLFPIIIFLLLSGKDTYQ